MPLALPLVAALLALVALLGFAVGGDNPVTQLDLDLLAAVTGGPRPLIDAARVLTYLGQFVLTVPLTALAAVLLWRRRRGPAAIAPLAGVLLASLATAVVKAIVERDRPDALLHAIEIEGFGFPSGHSSGAAACWVGLALACAPRERRAPWLLAAAGVLLIVGATRVVLGVHSPSDVVAGWALGAACALAAALAASLPEPDRAVPER